MRERACVWVVVALAAFVGLAGVAPAADSDGWKSLFDGKTLDGWEQHSGKAVYAVEDGAIVGHSVPNTGNSFLCTKETYGDFELEFEVKVDNALNSGVQIRSQIKPENDRVFGPQVEIAAGPGPSGFVYGEATGRNWLSPNPKSTTAFKNGEWNQYRVVAKGANIKTWINGEAIEDLTDEPSPKQGLIGLQVHGVGNRAEPLYVRWRNLRIKPLH